MLKDLQDANTAAKIARVARSLLTDFDRKIEVAEAISQATDQFYEDQKSQTNWDEELIRRQVESSMVGFGSLTEILEDSSVEEIWINAPNRIYVSKNSKTVLLDLELDRNEVRQTVERMLRDSGRRLDRSEPFVDATLADGSRLHVVIPDVTKKEWAVNIRKFPSTILGISDLVEKGSMPADVGAFLSQQYKSGRNMLVSGATQAGKTTLLCALLEQSTDQERIISVEETFEIRTNHPDWVALQARQANLEGVGEITLRRLVREALRMRPTRLIIGEVRQAEALDLLIALNSGIAGICTIHANSALEAIEKLKLLPLLAGENIPAKFVAETVERTIDVVVQLDLDLTGKRRVATVIQAKRDQGNTTWCEVFAA